MNLPERLKHALINLPGYRTKRKVVVIESDDWGSIRSNRKHYDVLRNTSIYNDLYSKYDQLEGEEDLIELFHLLNQFRDLNDRKPIITTNTVIGNPDFQKIRESKFQEYYWEKYTETLKKVYPNTNVFGIWKQGIDDGYIKPQFHGREHVNVNSWLNDLQNKNELALKAYHNQSFSYPALLDATNRNNHMAAFDHSNNKGLELIKSSIHEGLATFYELFGFKSKTMIAPCYVWSEEVESIAQQNGVTAMQGIRYQHKPNSRLSYKRKLHYTGQVNRLNQTYIVRNAFYEPTHFGVDKSVNDVLERANILFALGKPLIIGSHRINYMGGIFPENRKSNLLGLGELLSKLIERYPEVEFHTSDELERLIRS